MRSLGLRSQRLHAGFTLVELLVALSLALVMLLALVVMYGNSSRSTNEVERTYFQVEAGRYALDQLVSEIGHAGYLGRFNPGTTTLPLPLAPPDPCLTDRDSLLAAIPMPIQGLDQVQALRCLPDLKPATDVLVLRRVQTCVLGDADCPQPVGSIFLQASACSEPAELGSPDATNHYRFSSVVAALDRTQRDCVTPAPSRRYVVNIFYVAENDLPGDGIPTLKRASLEGDGFAVQSIAAGVEDLQLEYGLDQDADGNPDVMHADPGVFQACEDEQCVANWRNVMMLFVHLLVRNRQASTATSDAETMTYVLGNDAQGTQIRRQGLADGYQRKVYSAVARTTNMMIRRE